MMSGNKRVKNALWFIRILSKPGMDNDNIKIAQNRKEIYVRSLQDAERSSSANSDSKKFWCFMADRIFFNSSQEDVYSSVMTNVLKSVLGGTNSVIMAYGQTGTGKSYTLYGLRNRYTLRGIVPRLITQMFEEKRVRSMREHIEYWITFVEFHGRYLRDLLSDSPEPGTCCTDLSKVDIKKVYVVSEIDALSTVMNGEWRRTILKTAPYKYSNKCHAVITIYVRNSSVLPPNSVVTHAKMHLVDLAGSDDPGRSPSQWKEQKDISMANLSKSLLEKYLVQLRRVQHNTHPEGNKYAKTCSLISYISDCVGPNTVMRFIGHIHGLHPSKGTTLSTLRFGQCINEVPNQDVFINVTINKDLEIINLQEQLSELRQKAETDSVFLRDRGLCEPGQAHKEQVRRATAAYLRGEISERNLLSVGDASLVLETFRTHYNNLQLGKIFQSGQEIIKPKTADVQTETTRSLKFSAKERRSKRTSSPNKRKDCSLKSSSRLEQGDRARTKIENTSNSPLNLSESSANLSEGSPSSHTSKLGFKKNKQRRKTESHSFLQREDSRHKYSTRQEAGSREKCEKETLPAIHAPSVVSTVERYTQTTDENLDCIASEKRSSSARVQSTSIERLQMHLSSARDLHAESSYRATSSRQVIEADVTSFLNAAAFKAELGAGKLPGWSRPSASCRGSVSSKEMRKEDSPDYSHFLKDFLSHVGDAESDYRELQALEQKSERLYLLYLEAARRLCGSDAASERLRGEAAAAWKKYRELHRLSESRWASFDVRLQAHSLECRGELAPPRSSARREVSPTPRLADCGAGAEVYRRLQRQAAREAAIAAGRGEAPGRGPRGLSLPI